jgi:dihydrofolate reductase
MFLSRVPGEYDGDAFFPDWNSTGWRLVEQTPFDGFTLEEWERVR